MPSMVDDIQEEYTETIKGEGGAADDELTRMRRTEVPKDSSIIAKTKPYG